MTIISLKDNDLGSFKTAVDHMSCETVRAEAQQRVAKLEDEMQRKQSVCADEKTKLDAIDASVAGARQQYGEVLAHDARPSLRAEINGIIKEIDSRVKKGSQGAGTLASFAQPFVMTETIRCMGGADFYERLGHAVKAQGMELIVLRQARKSDT